MVAAREPDGSGRPGANGWPSPTRRRFVLGLGAGGLVLAAGGLAACSRDDGSRPAGDGGAGDARPGGGAELIAPAELVSAGGALEVDLVVAPAMVPFGDRTRWALTYNGTTPGPTWRVRPGDLVTVRLENRLDQPTNLHTHGLRVSPDGDGDNPFVMVEPGGRHTYRYRLPADHPGGTFWYHPHHHGNVAPQLFGGLAGTIVVEDDLDDRPALAGATERVLVLADATVGGDAGILRTTMMQQMMGREGEVVLVNSQDRPVVRARPGTLEHWRLVNASPSRFYAVRVDGVALHLIAREHGRLDRPQRVDEVVLVPGERAEVLVEVGAAGRHDVRTAAVERGAMGMGGMGGMGGGRGGGMGGGGITSAATTLATLVVEGERAGDIPALPDGLDPIEDLTTVRPDGSRTLTFSMTMGMGGGGDQFRIDGKAFHPERTDVTVGLGEVEDWTITNTTPMDHPFHLHVWPFQVIGRTDGRPLDRGWKDTVNVPAGASVTIRIPFRDIPGRAVYHCHILDHEDLGMMGVIEVR